MLTYLLNLSIPVLIYFISNISILLIQTFLKLKRKLIFKFFLFFLLISIFLEYLFRRGNKILVWLIVLAPLILLILVIVCFLYLFLFNIGKNETLRTRFKNLGNLINIFKKLLTMDLFNVLKTMININ
jgi:hypothetical protein